MMQKNIRVNESQLLYLVSKARRENSIASYLYKRSSDTGKWQQRFFVLYQNLLFYFENDTASRPSGVALLEGSYCDRLITPPLRGKELEKQVIIKRAGLQHKVQVGMCVQGRFKLDCTAHSLFRVFIFGLKIKPLA